MKKRYMGPIRGRALGSNLKMEGSVDYISPDDIEYIDDIEEYGASHHCCAEMNFHVNEKERIIKYFPQIRKYAFQIRKEGGIQQLFFCPWCGTSLPKSVSNEFFDLIEEKKINLETTATSDLPSELQNEEWWKKRNL